MAISEGTQLLKVYRGEYDFAVDGGAIGTIPLRGGGTASTPIPSGSFIMGGFIEIDTLFTTGTGATAAIQIEAANDLQTATIVSGAPYSTTGRKAIVPVFTAATIVKTTAQRSPSMVVATGTITAGKGRLVLFYY